MKREGLSACIIADDLTGAMDAAAPFAKRGLITRVVVCPDAVASQPAVLDGPVDVISFNTETRHVTPARARADTAHAVQKLTQQRPAILFKKIDSTMRGHVVEETLAALSASDRSRAVLTPATPAQGRTVKDGCVFVGGTPLKNTPIGRDLRAPPPSGPIHDMLKKSNPDIEVANIPAGGELLLAESSNVRVLVADCEVQSDLVALAQQVVKDCEGTLVVGAAGLAEALAELAFGPVPPASPRVADDAGLLVYVVGSRTPESARQTERLIASIPGAMVLEVIDGEAVAEVDLERFTHVTDSPGVVVIRPKSGKGADAVDADHMANALADSTALLVERAPVALLAMTGGDTAQAVLRRLGVTVIEVAGEVRPGIVFGRVQLQEHRLWVLTKAGGFGDDELFLDIEQFFHNVESKT